MTRLEKLQEKINASLDVPFTPSIPLPELPECKLKNLIPQRTGLSRRDEVVLSLLEDYFKARSRSLASTPRWQEDGIIPQGRFEDAALECVLIEEEISRLRAGEDSLLIEVFLA